jgi:hypothetical protein
MGACCVRWLSLQSWGLACCVDKVEDIKVNCHTVTHHYPYNAHVLVTEGGKVPAAKYLAQRWASRMGSESGAGDAVAQTAPQATGRHRS